MKAMLDLETLSSRPNAAVVAIGAVAFDKDGIKGEPFYAAVTPQSAENAGGHVSASTFQWWCQQSDAARALFSDKEAAPLLDALKRFRAWCKAHAIDEMWGNGADFDCVILGAAYESLNEYRPWRYSQNRCFRTLRSLVSEELNHELWTKYATGTHHNALDDAVRQANIAIEILKGL